MEEIKADDNIELSHNDNEDSLNLTIGEEEEQLLRDEENDVKPKGELEVFWTSCVTLKALKQVISYNNNKISGGFN